MNASVSHERVLVTGAGGLIGSAVCRELANRGRPVRALLLPGETDANVKDIANAEIVRGDVRDVPRMASLMRGAAACIHAAALNRLWHRPHRDLYDINVRGTENLCRAALAAGIPRFVFTSSCEVMGPARPGPLADETRLLDAISIRGHYERSKFFAEELVRRFAADRGLPAVILRPTAVFGPGDVHGTPPGRLVRAFLRRAVPAFYDAGINVVDAQDVAAAHVAALDAGRTGEVYIAGGHNVRLSEIFRLMEETSGIPAPKKTVRYWTAYGAATLLSAKALLTGEDPGITISGIRTIRHPWHFDTTKAKRELRLSPRPIEETISDAIAWQRHCAFVADSPH